MVLLTRPHCSFPIFYPRFHSPRLIQRFQLLVMQTMRQLEDLKTTFQPFAPKKMDGWMLISMRTICQDLSSPPFLNVFSRTTDFVAAQDIYIESTPMKSLERSGKSGSTQVSNLNTYPVYLLNMHHLYLIHSHLCPSDIMNG